MTCLHNVWFLNYLILICRASFVCFMESLCIEASKRLLATSHLFNYTNDSLKMSTNCAVVCFGGGVSLESDLQGGWDLMLSKFHFMVTEKSLS